jgi:hypothetical protein
MDCTKQMIRGLVVVLLALGFRASHAQESPFVRDVFQQLNTQRQQHGLNRCSYDKKLEKAAQFHAECMARNRKMEHLEEEAKTFEQQKTCNHHPANRAINAGYFAWDQLYDAQLNATGAVIHPKPGANDRIGEIIAAGWNAGHPMQQTKTIVTGWMNDAAPNLEPARFIAWAVVQPPSFPHTPAVSLRRQATTPKVVTISQSVAAEHFRDGASLRLGISGRAPWPKT